MATETPNLAITFQFSELGDPGDLVAAVIDRMLDSFPEGDSIRPATFHLAISDRPFSDLEDRIREWALPTGKEPTVGLVKHGEGSVIPENDQQKTAAQQGGQMTEQDREDLARENADADGQR